MEPVTSLSSYRALLRSLKQGSEQTETNSVLMAPALEALIREGRLYVRVSAGAVILFVHQGAWYDLYYHRRPDAPLGDLRADMPVAAVLLRDGAAPPGEALLHAGFRLHKTSLHLALDVPTLSCNPDMALESARKRLRSQGVALERCPEALLPQVHALWRAGLDLTDVPPDHLVPDGSSVILCARTESGQVAAAVWGRRTGVRMETRHAVTHPDFRRRGLASALLLAQLSSARDPGLRTVHTWVSETNLPSLAMFSRLGFAPDGRASLQYLLNETI